MNPIDKLTVTENVSVFFFERLGSDGRLMSELLTKLVEEGVNIDMISQSAPHIQPYVSLSFSIDDSALVKTLRVCNPLGLKPMVSSSNCKLSLFGAGMVNTPGVAAQVVATIIGCGCEIQLITTSEIDISCLLPRLGADSAIEALKKTFQL